MAENTSEVSRLLSHIGEAYEAAQHGLTGLASGTARHCFINAKLERMSELHDSLHTLVGEQAMPLIAQHLDTLPDAAGPAEEAPTRKENRPAMSTHETPLPHNSYIIDIESGTETVRLMNQDRLLTGLLGGVLPKEIPLSKRQAVLDLACGPGGWVLDVAYQYPAVQVVGLDLSRTMVAYARAQARVQGLENAAFVVMDVTKPLDFPDASFDLVNGRLLASFLHTSAWLPLVRECLRLLRPGGILRLTECERGSSTSPALEELTALFTLALSAAGHSFSPDGRTLGITPVLGRFLRDVGCTHITQRAYALDYSVGTPLYHPMVQNASVVWHLLLPFLSRMGVITAERFEALYRQMQIDLLADEFCALWSFLSIWGSKPHTAAEQASEVLR